MYTPWDALTLIADTVVGSAGKWLTYELEVGRITYEYHDQVFYAPDDGDIACYEYTEAMRDMQKYGVLLDWCKLWEAK
jgi:hypothetical protein